MKNPFDLTGKTIVITGASSGIGQECAIATSKAGANVVLLGRDLNRLESTYSQLAEGNHLYFSQEITGYDKLEGIIQQVFEKIGKISGFIHSAGIEMTLPLRSMKANDYEQLFAINVIAGFEIARILSKKKYCDEQSASFVFISSVMGLLGQIGKIAYCSSKGALISGCKAMALELAPKNIKVNCVLPGVVKTRMTDKMFENLSEESMNSIKTMHPLGIGVPEDVAHACVFLLSDAARWITGTSLVVDGGYSIA